MNLRRLILLCAVTAPALAGLLRGAGDAPRRPNILYILADDMGWTAPSCFGNKDVATPHLDRLAAQGMRFTQAYAETQCSPTRAAFLSGQFGARSGVFRVTHEAQAPFTYLQEPKANTALSAEVATLARTLRAAGYATGLSGKWHITPDYDAAPLRERDGGKYFDRYGFDYCGAADQSVQVEDKAVVAITDEIIGFIERNQARPWFAYVAHFSPHTRLLAPKALIEKHAARGYKRTTAPNGRFLERPSAEYLAMLEHLDHHVGRLLARLDDLGLANDTLVVFTSDNGGLQVVTSNAPLRAGKGSPYEGGLRVPMMVRWPGKIADVLAEPWRKPDPAALRNWQDMRFGMFIHWGPGEHQRGADQLVARVRQRQIEVYDNLYEKFDAPRFDPDAWASIAKAAGMKYVVLTTKHHDGFCLWDTKQTGYNVMNAPLKRDVVKELAECLPETGAGVRHLLLGLRLAQPRLFPACGVGGSERAREVGHRGLPSVPAGAGDGADPAITARCRSCGSMCRRNSMPPRVGRTCASAARSSRTSSSTTAPVAPRARALATSPRPERKIGAFNMDRPWESCMTLCNSWSWKPNDQMKPLAECIQSLVRDRRRRRQPPVQRGAHARRTDRAASGRPPEARWVRGWRSMARASTPRAAALSCRRSTSSPRARVARSTCTSSAGRKRCCVCPRCRPGLFPAAC
jgi:arylsulfatase A-like enzyme